MSKEAVSEEARTEEAMAEEGGWKRPHRETARRRRPGGDGPAETAQRIKASAAEGSASGSSARHGVGRADRARHGRRTTAIANAPDSTTANAPDGTTTNAPDSTTANESDHALHNASGNARPSGRDGAHTRPAGLNDRTVTALGNPSEALGALGALEPSEPSEALGALEAARGTVDGFHRLTGKADPALGEAVDPLREAGRAELAEGRRHLFEAEMEREGRSRGRRHEARPQE